MYDVPSNSVKHQNNFQDYLIHVKGVSKSFPGVKTLDQVEFTLRPGEVHALVGENGAGKSSLMKIISGVYQPDEGEITMFGQVRKNLTPRATRDLGISMIHQELSLVPQMNAIQNLFLGDEKIGSTPLLLDNKKSRKAAENIFKQLEIDIDLDVPVKDLPLAKQQMIEISRCLYTGAKVIIMDEPTSSLSEKEVRSLFKLINYLKKQNVGIIYISHFFEELFEICDCATILRDGKFIDHVQMSNVTKDDLVRMMVGRDLSGQFERSKREKGEEVLRIENFTSGHDVQNVSLSLHAGEVVGLAGIIGAGRTTLARMIIGDILKDEGKIYLNGKHINIKSPLHAIQSKIAYIPEDRKGKGLILGMDISGNTTLPILNKVINKGLLNRGKLVEITKKYIKDLNIKPSNHKMMARNLSGGNQQKIVLAKWLAANARIFIFNEPTRGIDIGAKREIYKLIDRLTLEGAAVLLISSELPELLGLSDRIMVMRQGKITKTWKTEETSEELIVKYALD